MGRFRATAMMVAAVLICLTADPLTAEPPTCLDCCICCYDLCVFPALVLIELAIVLPMYWGDGWLSLVYVATTLIQSGCCAILGAACGFLLCCPCASPLMKLVGSVAGAVVEMGFCIPVGARLAERKNEVGYMGDKSTEGRAVSRSLFSKGYPHPSRRSVRANEVRWSI